jgi:hypothetical protein
VLARSKYASVARSRVSGQRWPPTFPARRLEGARAPPVSNSRLIPMSIDYERTERVSFRVSRREREWLEAHAQRHGVPLSALVREAVGLGDGSVRLRPGELTDRDVLQTRS